MVGLKFCVAFPFHLPQGGEQTYGIIVDEMARRGAQVSVATVLDIDIKAFLKKYFNLEISGPLKTYSLLSPRFSSLHLFAPFLNQFTIRRAVRTESPDVILTDGIAFRGIKTNERQIHINRISEPVSPELTGEFPRETLNIEGKVGLYNRVYKALIDLIDTKTQDTVIVNSKWSAGLYKKFFGGSSTVIYPPVQTGLFHPKEKENIVSCIGAIHPRKNFSAAISALARTRTRPQLKIVGSLHPRYRWHKDQLLELASRLGVEDRVEVLPNLSMSEKIDLVGRATVCLSCGVEYFGIALVEQMAAGAVPIVFKGGGPWHDVIEYGKYGFGFSTEEELAGHIDNIISSKAIQREYSVTALERSRDFSEQHFRNEFGSFVMDLWKKKAN